MSRLLTLVGDRVARAYVRVVIVLRGGCVADGYKAGCNPSLLAGGEFSYNKYKALERRCIRCTQNKLESPVHCLPLSESN